MWWGVVNSCRCAAERTDISAGNSSTSDQVSVQGISYAPVLDEVLLHNPLLLAPLFRKATQTLYTGIYYIPRTPPLYFITCNSANPSINAALCSSPRHLSNSIKGLKGPSCLLLYCRTLTELLCISGPYLLNPHFMFYCQFKSNPRATVDLQAGPRNQVQRGRNREETENGASVKMWPQMLKR